MKFRTLEWRWSILAIAVALLASYRPASAETIIIGVEMDGIQGEGIRSLDTHYSGYREGIQVLGVSGGVTVPKCTSFPCGRRTEFTDLSLVKGIDRATPQLLHESARGTLVKNVTISFFRPDPLHAETTAFPFYEIRLENVTISGVRSNAGSDGVTELVTLTFTRIRWIVRIFDSQGSVTGQVISGWDLNENKSY